MGREYRILSQAQRRVPAAPEPLAYCEDAAVLGAPFYLMERAARRHPPQSAPDGARPHAGARSRTLSRVVRRRPRDLHAVDYRAAGLGDFGKPDGLRRAPGDRLDQALRTTRRPTTSRRWIEVARVARRAHPARRAAPALIHNDYKFDNMVLDPDDLTRIIGVLDWEMSTIGDPLMDLGTALGYWVDADDPEPAKAFAFGPTTMPGSLTRRELAERYGAKTGRDVSNMVFYYVFALFKTAVIVQQIYYRYAKGLTKDERFAGSSSACACWPSAPAK